MSGSNILIFQGVALRDFNPLNTATRTAIACDDDDIYTDMPTKFTGPAEWIQFSNLKCWECDQYPGDYPKFIPIDIVDTAEGIRCDVFGHFCEWNCAVRHASTMFDERHRWDAIEAIRIIESQFTGKRREKIMPAPSKTEMKAYCGNRGITAAQWREKLDVINTNYALSSASRGW